MVQPRVGGRLVQCSWRLGGRWGGDTRIWRGDGTVLVVRTLSYSRCSSGSRVILCDVCVCVCVCVCVHV